MLVTTDQWCFCTLALGEPYRELTKQLANDLAQFAPGISFFVLTDNPRSFEETPNVVAVQHSKRSVLGYNDKLSVVGRALDQYRTAVFIDADVRVLGSVELHPEIFKPGLRAFLLRTWSYYHDRTLQMLPWQREDLRIMALLRDGFIPDEDGRGTPIVVESLFAVTRNGAEGTETFLRKWNQLAEFCERRKFFVHEGFSVGLAARLTNFPIEQHDFNGLKFFEPRLSRVVHVPNGTMTEEEYRVLNATIDRYRPTQGKTLPVRAAVGALKVWVRYLRIKLFGLNLIDL